MNPDNFIEIASDYGDARPFIEITSDWGKIGNFVWSNSITTPYHSYWFYCKVIFWGGYTFNYDESKMIGKECYVEIEN